MHESIAQYFVPQQHTLLVSGILARATWQPYMFGEKQRFKYTRHFYKVKITYIAYFRLAMVRCWKLQIRFQVAALNNCLTTLSHSAHTVTLHVRQNLKYMFRRLFQ